MGGAWVPPARSPLNRTWSGHAVSTAKKLSLSHEQVMPLLHLCVALEPRKSAHPYLPSCTVIIEPSQCLFHFRILRFDGIKGLWNAAQALCVVWFIDRASLVFVCAVMLDFFTRILDLGQSQRGRRTFEEMALGTQLRQISILPRVQSGKRMTVAGNDRVERSSCAGISLHKYFHLFKGGLGLLEKPIDDTFGELALLFIIIHL